MPTLEDKSGRKIQTENEKRRGAKTEQGKRSTDRKVTVAGDCRGQTPDRVENEAERARFATSVYRMEAGPDGLTQVDPESRILPESYVLHCVDRTWTTRPSTACYTSVTGHMAKAEVPHLVDVALPDEEKPPSVLHYPPGYRLVLYRVMHDETMPRRPICQAESEPDHSQLFIHG